MRLIHLNVAGWTSGILDELEAMMTCPKHLNQAKPEPNSTPNVDKHQQVDPILHSSQDLIAIHQVVLDTMETL